MNKAFDVVFQAEVEAEVVAKKSHRMIGNKFRYKCLCCGEEVYLAAADSNVQSPHFRHRKGNNDTDCERYLGQPGAVEHYISLRKKDKEYIDFGFNRDHLTFEMVIKYTSEEIDQHAMNKSQLFLYTKSYSQPFFKIPINRGNLIPDVNNYFTLNEYSNDYYVFVDGSSSRTVYSDIIKREGKLNIYKVNQSGCHYKRSLSDVLYTNCKYLAISEIEDNIRELSSFTNIKNDSEVFSFITQGRQFYAVEFVIQFVEYLSALFFQKHNLTLESSESIVILWPPVSTKDSVSVCATEKIYISSSFELIPYGNISPGNVNIENTCKDVSEIAFRDRLTICEKNVESRIVKDEKNFCETVYEEPMKIYTDKYSIPDKYDYYMFDQNGCSKLLYGSKVYLSGTDRIVGYKNGHIKEIVLPKQPESIDKALLINDILKYHPQAEPFEPDDFMDILPDESVLLYIESCYRSGKINTVLKRYIKEGLI